MTTLPHTAYLRVMKTACREPGCTAIIEREFCDRHQSRQDDRPSAAERGYDGRWRRFRKRYLEAHPFCEDPFDRHGSYSPEATVVDHIIPIRDGGARLDPSNAQSLCRGCHAMKTRRETA